MREKEGASHVDAADSVVCFSPSTDADGRAVVSLQHRQPFIEAVARLILEHLSRHERVS